MRRRTISAETSAAPIDDEARDGVDVGSDDEGHAVELAVEARHEREREAVADQPADGLREDGQDREFREQDP
jgi:hypothetical protein